MIFPWQMTQWLHLSQAKKKQQLSHALLLSGMKGIGKEQFATSFIHSLLCQKSHEEAPYYCNNCHDCRLIAAKVHPNVRWIEGNDTQEKSTQIKVDQIREVNEFVQTTSLQGKYRIVLIHPADNMNIHAANALLKTLEEPAPFAILVLICEQLSSLPATILSRCQQIHFMRPDRAISLNWLNEQTPDTSHNLSLLLNLANGAPLQALQLKENEVLKVRQNLFQVFCLLQQREAEPVYSANQIQEIEILSVLDYFLSWMLDLLRLQLGGKDQEIINQDFAVQLTKLQQSTSVENNMQFVSFLQNLRIQLVRGINLNKQMAIESIFIRWRELSICS